VPLLAALLTALELPALVPEPPGCAAETPAGAGPLPGSLSASSAEGVTGAPSIGAAPSAPVGIPVAGGVPAEPVDTGEGLPDGGNGAPLGLPPAGLDESPFLPDLLER
jgi:hypothetical protein